MLFTDAKSPWTTTGVTDIKHLAEKVKKHESTPGHVTNVLRLRMFGKVNIATQLDDVYRAGIREHNRRVDQNRHVLSKLISTE